MDTGQNNQSHQVLEQKGTRYRRLYRKFVFLTLIGSLVPLLLVGWGIYIYYSNFSSARVTEYFQSQVEDHRKIIELFLKERTADLQLVALTHSLEELQKPGNLMAVLSAINQEGQFFTDLGLISEQGRHLAYIGPYNLMDKDYSQSFWFKELMDKKVFISDMFMGFRNTPHFIIAFLRVEGDRRWILRASVDTEYLRSLVENVKIGRTGEAYLLNREGIFQTSPRSQGAIMEKAPLALGQFKENSGTRILSPSKAETGPTAGRQIFAFAWLEDPQWLLIVKQNYSEAFRTVNHANLATLIFLHLSLLGIVIITVIITRTMIKTIKKRDEQADQLNRQLMQAGKLASLGELSAGVAHEINNPLAIILTENQVIRDLIDQTEGLDEAFKQELEESLSQIDAQVQRCNLITHNLLRFSRRTGSRIEMVNLNAFLKEVIQLMEGKAKGRGVQFNTGLEKDLEPIRSDPSQLQQVFLNLIVNAIDAHEGKPYGTISISTHSNLEKQGVEIIVADTGSGIPPENLEKIFDPFFTTKPVGKGTGLGLSISYSIIKQLGGDLSVQSEAGKGAQFNLFLPFNRAEDSQGIGQENLDPTSPQIPREDSRK
ncbi:MAG: two-component sensor histidine kinase [Deltaproteobacteria bacterium]|nr:two-component sensor histidine kinase [Deltaproteobacteria bacterium]